MKKLNYLFLSIFAFSSLFLTSCGGDDEEDPKGPSIAFVTGTGFVSTGLINVTPGETFKVRVTLSKGDKNLSTLSITEDGNAISDLTRLTIGGIAPTENPITSPKETTYEISVVTKKTDGTTDYGFVVTDKDGKTASLTVKAVIRTIPEFKEATGKQLGAQSATPGSYYATTTAVVVKSADFAGSASIIDFSFAQTGATTVQPKLIAVNARASENLTVNTVGKKCYFKKSTLDYASVTKEQIDAIAQSTSEVVVVEANGVYEFVTEAGKKGLILVTALDDAASFKGTVTLSVKVQQ